MIEHKNDANTLFWHIVYASFWTKANLSHFLWNLKDPVLVQTLSNSRKITYYPAFLMQDIGHMLHLHVVQTTASIILMRQWAISYHWQRCWAEQTISICYSSINKILPDLVVLLTWEQSKGKEAWHTFFTAYIIINHPLKTQSDSKLCSYVLVLRLAPTCKLTLIPANFFLFIHKLPNRNDHF